MLLRIQTVEFVVGFCDRFPALRVVGIAHVDIGGPDVGFFVGEAFVEGLVLAGIDPLLRRIDTSSPSSLRTSSESSASSGVSGESSETSRAMHPMLPDGRCG